MSDIMSKMKSNDPVDPFSPRSPCSPGGPRGPLRPGDPGGPTGPRLHLQNFLRLFEAVKSVKYLYESNSSVSSSSSGSSSSLSVDSPSFKNSFARNAFVAIMSWIYTYIHFEPLLSTFCLKCLESHEGLGGLGGQVVLQDPAHPQQSCRDARPLPTIGPVKANIAIVFIKTSIFTPLPSPPIWQEWSWVYEQSGSWQHRLAGHHFSTSDQPVTLEGKSDCLKDLM